MELCGGSYNPANDIVNCQAPQSYPSQAVTDSNNDHVTHHEHSLLPPPVTPVPGDTMGSPGTDTKGSVYHGATPSPLFLNPMTDEDWSSRKLSSKLRLTLSEVDARQLMEGIELTLLRGQDRRPVKIKFDAGKAMICVTFFGSEKAQVADEKKLDCLESELAPFQVPITSLVGLKQSDSSFTLRLKSIFNGAEELQFECSSLAQKDAVVDGLKTFMDVSRPLQRRRWLPKLKTSPLQYDEQLGDEGGEFSLLDGRFSPISLTEDSLRENPASPVHGSACSLLGVLSPRRIRMHEASAMPDHYNNMPSSTPAEQGVELTLIDAALETANTTDSAMHIPELKESFSTDSTVLNNPFCVDVGFNSIKVPGDLFGLSLSSGPIGSAPMTLNPWCANDICTITTVTEAFGDLFGVGVTESKNPAPESGSGDTDSTVVQCFGSSLPVADDVYSPLKRITSDDAVAAKATRNNVRNRSASVHRQAAYWQELKNQMTFEVVWRSLSHIQRTKSMDETDMRQDAATSPRPSSFLESVFDHLYATPGAANSKSEDTPDEDDVLYYDSDPEDARERTFRGGSRQWERYELRRVPRLRLPRAIVHSRSLSDGDIKTIVDIMKSCTLYFLWHPNPTAEVPLPKPCCVQAWIERGTYLFNQNFVQPKFMWKPVHEAQLATRRKINLKVEKFDLLEIARIECDPALIDHSIYPLAHKPSCFFIKTKSSHYLFQAPSVEEKAHVVFGLKLTVARLASLLICRDMSAVDEFFEPTEASVPGHAPSAAAVCLPE
ncbi:hypothetical protein MHU86_3606 [Fragilaria crotonensis]|nr:hypothetical protein MHU86_3606 [Fragilaria crotonensis]